MGLSQGLLCQHRKYQTIGNNVLTYLEYYFYFRFLKQHACKLYANHIQLLDFFSVYQVYFNIFNVMLL